MHRPRATQSSLIATWIARLRRRATERTEFVGSANYWESRYRGGRNSGSGSYGALAAFKADIVNQFVAENDVASVIEYGCGDGNQLRSAKYESYVGFDVSAAAVAACRERFAGDTKKRFEVLSDYSGERADLTLSLDVVYHLVEDAVFEAHMDLLFRSADRFVIIYSSNTDAQLRRQSAHVKHRRFGDWIERHHREWSLIRHIPNQHPLGRSRRGSFADFYIYTRQTAAA